MPAISKKRIAAGLGVLAFISLMLDAAAQEGEGTKFRGIGLHQSIEEVVKVLASNGFRPLETDPDSIQARKGNGICAFVDFENERASDLVFLPCFFELDNQIDPRAFAQQIVNNYPIPTLNKGTRQITDLYRREYLQTYYYGRLETGESLEIIIDADPKRASSLTLVVRPSSKPASSNLGGVFQ